METTSLESCGLPVKLGQHAVVLLPQRAVWWPDQQTLFVADTHFGKEATFRHAAIPVPDQTHEQLQRLDEVLTRTNSRRLIVLGDLQHSRRGRCAITLQSISEWRRQNSSLKIQLIRGNHDVGSGEPPAEWKITTLIPPVAESSLQFVHDPEDVWGLPGCLQGPREETAALAGHMHPAIRLRGRGRDSLRLSCFLLRRGVLVLPAFSSFVDSRVVAPESGDQIFAVAKDTVVAV